MILVGNGRLLCFDQTKNVLEDGCVAIEADLIVAVGKTLELKEKYPQAQFINAEGGVIMPGLINTHHHIYSAFARGLTLSGYAPKGFLDILEGQWWRLDNDLNLKDTYMSGLVTYLACIKAGVTTVFDHHASYGQISDSLFTLEEAAQKLGIRTCLCYEVSDRGGKEKLKLAIKENNDFMRHTLKPENNLVKAMMGLHASFTLSDSSLALVRENTPKEFGFHIHVAEGIADVDDSLAKHGKRVVNRLHDQGILGDKTIAAHCIHINSAEIELLQSTNTMVVHNPESNMSNAVGCPPVLAMLKAGVLVGLGTDGYTSDMLESFKVANCLQKHYLCDPTVAWAEIPQLLFEHNPKIAQRYFKHQLGVLEPGALADVIVVDYDPPTPFTQANQTSHIMFGMCGANVKTTIINGKVKMLEGKLVEVDEAEIMAQAREQSSDLWQRLNG